METIFHPVSGEKGYFATETEKLLIDVALDTLLHQDENYSSSQHKRGLNE